MALPSLLSPPFCVVIEFFFLFDTASILFLVAMETHLVREMRSWDVTMKPDRGDVMDLGEISFMASAGFTLREIQPTSASLPWSQLSWKAWMPIWSHFSLVFPVFPGHQTCSWSQHMLQLLRLDGVSPTSCLEGRKHGQNPKVGRVTLRS